MKTRIRQWLCLGLSMLLFCCMTVLPTAAEDIAVTPMDYGITVGSVLVTPDNKDNIAGDGITFGEGGYIRYDPATKTLTLCNASINGYTRYENDWGQAYIGGLDTGTSRKVVLIGENSITVDVSAADTTQTMVYGLGGGGVVTGGGSLAITVDGGVFNMYGAETSSTFDGVDLTIRVGCKETETKCLNAIGLRVPNGTAFANGKLDITVGDVQNSSIGIDAMMDVTLTDMDTVIRTGTGRFSGDAISVMAHPMDDFISGLILRGGSLKAYSNVNVARVQFLDMGEDSWYKYAVNNDDMTETDDYTMSADLPLTPELLYEANYIHIVDRDTVILTQHEIETAVLVEEVNETVSKTVSAGVDYIAEALSDGILAPIAEPVLVPAAEAIAESAVDLLAEILPIPEICSEVVRFRPLANALAELAALLF